MENREEKGLTKSIERRKILKLAKRKKGFIGKWRAAKAMVKFEGNGVSDFSYGSENV
jgi:hypothetical protein